jgi:repressor LexA
MAHPLTELERSVLDYLVDYLRRNTYQPSVREIGRRFDIKSTKTVSELLQSLADKGWIERDPSRSRGVRLLSLDLDAGTITVPFFRADPGLENGAAGAVDHLELDRKLAGATGTFIVRMVGGALIAEGIRDGDLLLAEPISTDRIEDGDLLLMDDLSVRRCFRRGSELVLEHTTNESPPTLVRSGDALRIRGRVISVVRRIRTPARDGADTSDQRPAEAT